jgi:hypothetical protein
MINTASAPIQCAFMCGPAQVPGGPSIACSTARAIEWDASFKGRADCSGRSVSGVHNMAYDASFKTQV